MRHGDVLQEDAVFLEDEALAAREFVVLPAEPMRLQPRAVGLVSGKAFYVVEGIGGGGRTLVR